MKLIFSSLENYYPTRGTVDVCEGMCAEPKLRWLKSNSQMPCRVHAVPMPYRAALIHIHHAAPLPFSDSAVSFVKVRVVAGNIRTASPTV
jgi:hypothetical protein